MRLERTFQRIDAGKWRDGFVEVATDEVDWYEDILNKLDVTPFGEMTHLRVESLSVFGWGEYTMILSGMVAGQRAYWLVS